MIVLDAYALLAFFQREPGFEIVRGYLQAALEDKESVLMTTVNVGEVLYVVMRCHGLEKMVELERHVYSLPIHIVDADMELARMAAQYKAGGGISYADCFAAAQARRSGATVVTGDPEFRKVEHEIAVRWLQP